MKYRDYLKSRDWKKKRGAKLGRKGGKKKRCAICNVSDNLHVHHLIYRDKLEDAEQNDLRILCDVCHETTHRLFRQGKLKFPSRDPNSRFTLTKTAVKKARGLRGNLFLENRDGRGTRNSGDSYRVNLAPASAAKTSITGLGEATEATDRRIR